MSGDAEIQSERTYLATARSALQAMHEDVVATETPLTSAEDNNYAWQNNLYLQVRAERAVALIDLPGVPLFFGRLDFEPGAVYTADRVYVGRRHVHDSGGKPIVVDWRAPIAPGLGIPRSVRQAPGSLQITQTGDLVAAVAAVCRQKLNDEGSIGIITPDTQVVSVHRRLCAEGLDVALLGHTDNALEVSRLVCVPATLAKGLEFDAVVIAEPARIVQAEPRGIQRLYVALTRAVSSLHIIHTEPLPAALAG